MSRRGNREQRGREQSEDPEGANFDIIMEHFLNFDMGHFLNSDMRHYVPNSDIVSN